MTKRTWEPDTRKIVVDCGNGIVILGEAIWSPSDSDTDYVRVTATAIRVEVHRFPNYTARIAAFGFVKDVFGGATLISVG